MALETVTYIGDLNPANPPGTDPKSQGDDHIRAGKAAAKNSFAGFTGAILVTGVDGGVANAYTLTPANPLLAYTARTLVEFSPTVVNTGACTMNISGLGVISILSVSGAPLGNNELKVGQRYIAIYDGAALRLLSVTKTYVDSLASSGSLPGQSLGLLQSDGALATFGKSLIFGLNFGKAADVASAASPDIWAGNGNMMHITGTTGITGFASAPQAGATRFVIFDAAVPLTNSANLVLPNGQNYTTAGGDMALVLADTTTKFIVLLFPGDGQQAVAAPYMKVTDTRAAGAAGGGNSVSLDITQTRTLNTVDFNSISGASLATNTITLPPGVYDVRGRGPASQVSRHQASLYNVTDAATALLGSSESTPTSQGIGTNSTFCGRLTLTSSKNFTVRHFTEAAQLSTGLGSPGNSSLPAVYTEVEIWKVG